MKIISLFSVTFFLLLSTSISFAKYDMDFEAETNSRQVCSDCQCVDPGVYYNDCVSTRKYCEQFGNIGLR